MNRVIKNFRNITYGPAPEDDQEVLEWIKALPSPNYNFINGEWAKPRATKTIQAINPANNNKLYKLSVSSKFDVDKAVKSAKKAFSIWSKTIPYKRSKFLYALARLIQNIHVFLLF